MSREKDGSKAKSKSPMPKKKKIIIAVVVVAVIAVVVGFFAIQALNAKKYAEALQSSQKIIGDTANTADDCVSLLMSVWDNAIFEKHDPDTDKYTCPDGKFVSDFNDALENLYSDKEFSDKLNTLNENQTKLLSLKATLQKPPKKFEAANEQYLIFLDTYIKYVDCVLDSGGKSYEDMNKKLNDLNDKMRDSSRNFAALAENFKG